MFDESIVTMDPVPSPGEGPLNRHLLGNHTNDRSLVSFGGNKRFGNPPFETIVGAEIEVAADAGAYWDIGLRKGITLGVWVGFGLTAQTSLTFDIGSGTRNDAGDAELISVPIPGLSLPTIGILKKFSLPRPRAGVYFNVDFFWEDVMQSNANLSPGVIFTAGTGYKVLEFYVNGGWGGISGGIDVKRNDKAFANLRFDDDMSISRADASLDVFAGLRPEMALELFGLGRLYINQRDGVDLTAIASSDSLPLSVCPDCDFLRLQADLVVENFCAGAWAGFVFDPWWFPKISASISREKCAGGELRAGLLSNCFSTSSDYMIFGGSVKCNGICCEPGLVCFNTGTRNECRSRFDTTCESKLPLCDAAGKCCTVDTLCSREEKACVPLPEGYVKGAFVKTRKIDFIENWLGTGPIVVLRFDPESNLPATLFEKGPYKCGVELSSTRTHMRVYQAIYPGPVPKLILEVCDMDGIPDNFPFNATLLHYTPQSGAKGYVEFYDNKVPVGYQVNGGNEIQFIAPKIK